MPEATCSRTRFSSSAGSEMFSDVVRALGFVNLCHFMPHPHPHKRQMILACADFTQVLRLAALLRNHCCGTALEDALHGLSRRINWTLTQIIHGVAFLLD